MIARPDSHEELTLSPVAPDSSGRWLSRRSARRRLAAVALAVLVPGLALAGLILRDRWRPPVIAVAPEAVAETDSPGLEFRLSPILPSDPYAAVIGSDAHGGRPAPQSREVEDAEPAEPVLPDSTDDEAVSRAILADLSPAGQVPPEPELGWGTRTVAEREPAAGPRAAENPLTPYWSRVDTAAKARLIQEGGGNAASEAAVARGLIWLAKQQKPNGSWVCDGSSRDEVIAATGTSLLPFLAAGQTHKPFKENKHQKTVETGLDYLIRSQRPDGSFSGAKTMYGHGIATLALCEAYGMTADKRKLLAPAQKAISYICAAQAPDGSWGYQPGTNGDTSITGWQV
ncbi:MAG: prenyltransferase/squalene oxidase repeat-containing protein, partial [Fimbriiglobus sp.]